jgi:hypothetical protein
MDAQLTHIQYCENVKSAWKTFCDVHEAKIIGNKLFFWRFFTIKMQKGEDLLAYINMVKSFADQLHSIKVKIEDEDVYMVLFMSEAPSFHNLVTSLESMSTKDVDLQFIVARLLHEVSKRKESENMKIVALLNKTHNANEKSLQQKRGILRSKYHRKQQRNQFPKTRISEQQFLANS